MLRRAKEATEARRVIQNGVGEILVRTKFRRDEMFDELEMCAEFIISPGQSVGMHTHDKNMDIFYVLSGELTAVDHEGREETVYPGDMILTGGGECHALCNNSDQEGVILVIVSPNREKACL